MRTKTPNELGGDNMSDVVMLKELQEVRETVNMSGGATLLSTNATVAKLDAIIDEVENRLSKTDVKPEPRRTFNDGDDYNGSNGN